MFWHFAHECANVQDTQPGIVQGVILMQGLVDGTQFRTANGHVLKNRARQIVAPTIFDNGFCLRISRYKNSLGGYKDGEGTVVAVRDGATVGKMFNAKPPELMTQEKVEDVRKVSLSASARATPVFAGR